MHAPAPGCSRVSVCVAPRMRYGAADGARVGLAGGVAPAPARARRAETDCRARSRVIEFESVICSVPCSVLEFGPVPTTTIVYREPAPHAYSGPDRTCSPRFSHIRTIHVLYSHAEISSEVV